MKPLVRFFPLLLWTITEGVLLEIVSADEPAARRIHVVVALCDNEHQGILPVNARIGNGDDLANNLYWGCSEGLWRTFDKSSDWKKIETKKADPDDTEAAVLETLTYRHKTSGALLIAEAWRGREIRAATERLLELMADDSEDAPHLVAWIGHNGLMDFRFTYNPNLKSDPRKDAIILACKSQAWFEEILSDRNVRPILMTDQFMYPGSFLLKAAADGWLKGESRAAIRLRAARAYATNQGISVKAASGIFTRFSD